MIQNVELDSGCKFFTAAARLLQLRVLVAERDPSEHVSYKEIDVQSLVSTNGQSW